MRGTSAISVVTGCLSVACSPEAEVLPPYGEVVVAVDTDAPVPALAARLRVDLHSDDGRWLDSRDVARFDEADWPASFSVYSTDEVRSRSVLVRLRAYPDGRVRDYRGERFRAAVPTSPPDAVVDEPAPTDSPRLVQDGEDRTPIDEPVPALAIDRLVRLRVEPGARRFAPVLLATACVGTMADLAGRRSCVDVEGERTGDLDVHLADEAPAAPSRVGSFARDEGCTVAPRPAGVAADGTPLHDEEICVPGGLFLLGSERLRGASSGGADLDPYPERWVHVPPLLVDRYELTVGRYRALRAAGLAPSIEPIENDQALATQPPNGATLCSYSAKPSPAGQNREAYALTCVPWNVAREICLFAGGDLLTEAQWEWIATASGRARETQFPWGDEEPSCDRQVYERARGADDSCDASPYGPAPVDAATGDVSPDGVVGLGGGVSELLLDRWAPYAAACWAGAPLSDPRCFEEGIDVERSARGSSWQQSALLLQGAMRNHDPTGDQVYTSVGLRCARRGAP